MSTMELTGEAIAGRVCELRRAWDLRGVNSYLSRALELYPFELVERVAIKAAQDTSAATPAVILVRCKAEFTKLSHRKIAPVNALPRSPRHCGYSICECDHRQCFKGWVEGPEFEPCSNCKPRLVAILAMADLSPEERDQLISERTTP